MRRLTTHARQQTSQLSRSPLLRAHTEEPRHRESPDLGEFNCPLDKISNLHKHNLQFPSNIQMGSTSLIFKPSVEFSIPQKTNIKNLHDYLKKQALIFRHKQKIMMHKDLRADHGEMVNHLKKKIVRMLKLQTKSQFLLQAQSEEQKQSKGVITIPTPGLQFQRTTHKINRVYPIKNVSSQDRKTYKKKETNKKLPILSPHNKKIAFSHDEIRKTTYAQSQQKMMASILRSSKKLKVNAPSPINSLKTTNLDLYPQLKSKR